MRAFALFLLPIFPMCAPVITIGVATGVSAAVAAEEPTILKFASVAPEGSVLAQELKRWGQDVDVITAGRLHIKWYLSGVAGDELEQGDRMMKGQLDGSAGGQMFCNRIIPSMRVTRLPGVFQSREEAADAINRLNPAMVKEAHDHGFSLLTAVSLGPDVIFTRTPVHSLAELRRLKLWRWDLDEVGIATSREMGLQVVPLPLADGARAYDSGRVDGFLAIPRGGARLPVVVARPLRDRPARQLHLELPRGHRALAAAPADAVPGGDARGRGARARALRGDGASHRRDASRRPVRQAGRHHACR